MAFHMVDTPRSEVAEKTLLSHAAELDFSTVNSFPSPSKDSHDLVKNMRIKRGVGLDTPRARAPLGERRNVLSKGEFTPLLKSAARNRIMQFGGSNKENSHLETPAGLRPTYNQDSPALPLNSSMLQEEHTGSSIGAGNEQGIPVPPMSSSLMSTPMPVLPTRRDGILDDNANLLTLREQEARLMQIDKENFSLKLKIHFMEEALRRNGKEFNEAAIKENTELKVDKVTLQRDLRQYRKSLAQAEKDLEDYRRQLIDYAEKVKRRHAAEGLQEELDQLKQLIAEKDSELEDLRRDSHESNSHEHRVETLNAQIEDLEAELRERDRMIEDKDDELERLEEQIRISSNEVEEQLEGNERELDLKEEQIVLLQHRLEHIDAEKEKITADKDAEINSISERLLLLQQKLGENNVKRSNSISANEQEALQRDRQIDDLQIKLREAEEKIEQLQKSQEELGNVKRDMGAELRRKSRELEDKDHELHSFQLKLDAAEHRDDKAEQLQDEIGDLQQELREKDRIIEEKTDQMNALKDLDEALIEAHDKIHELGIERTQTLKELQDIRDEKSRAETPSQALADAQDRIQEHEKNRLALERSEQQLQREINELQSRINILRQQHEDKESQFATERDIWKDEKCSLEAQILVTGEKIKNLELNLQSLQARQGGKSDSEQVLQRTIENLQMEKVNIERALKEKVENLEDEIEVLQSSLDEVQSEKDDLAAVRQESEGLQRQIKGFQLDLARSEKELDAIRSHQKSASPKPSPDDLFETIEDLQDTLSRVKKERNDLQSRLSQIQTAQADAKATIETLRIDLRTATSSNDELKQQLQELRDELRVTVRDSDRKLAESERDIQNLEQDLAEAHSKEQHLINDNNSLDSQILELKSKVQELEQGFRIVRSNAGSPNKTESAEANMTERKELHALLKNAKLEAEDLALQLRSRDSRLKSMATKETALRTQLQRIRDERNNQASRADSAGRELEELHNEHEKVIEKLKLMEPFPIAHLSAGIDASAAGKRHAAELRGLARQIEYLTARMRREEAFRRDLSYAKAYFLKQVEMYTACNAVDLRLVGSMGIPVTRILEEEQSRKRGRTITSLRSLACIVIATVRMKKGADRWNVVKDRHESVLRKLEDVRRARVPAKKKSKVLPRS